ncbi:MAG: MobF family relaxase [Planctomycetota bacterium]
MLRWADASTNPSDVVDYVFGRKRKGLADYYLVHEEQGIGYWGGRGAERLGLEGPITEETFSRLCENRHPFDPDQSLTERNKVGRRIGWDISFSMPKSVSLIWAATKDERIVAAMQRAVDETMRDMELYAAVRVRKGGSDKDRVSGNGVWAVLTHYTSRPTDDKAIADPQLHCHAYLMNASYDETEDQWKALQNGPMRKRARYFEAGFHARASQYIGELGFPIERRGKAGWEIATVSRPLIERFSARTQQIEALAKRLGLKSPEAIAKLGEKTRGRKNRDITLAQLHSHWTDRMSAHEVQAMTNFEGVQGSPALTTRQALEHAMAHCFERESVVEDWQIQEQAMRFAMGSVTPEQVATAFDEMEWLSYTDEEGHKWVTTQEVLDKEKWLITFAREGRGTQLPLGDPDRVIQPREVGDQTITLNAEQQNAIRHIWSSFDQIISIRGVAGVGKTTLLQEAKRGMDKQIIALAPSAEASRGVLREAGFESADTIASFLASPKLQQAAKDNVVLVDEASQVGIGTMIELCKQVQKLNARLILVGDSRQHHSVEAGDALRVLEKYAGIEPAEVTQILRQQGDYKQAVEHFSRGEVDLGFDKLIDMNALIKLENGDQRYQQLARDYVDTVNKGKSALVVSPTIAEGEQTTLAIREQLKKVNIIDPEHAQTVDYQRDLQWSNTQKTHPALYEAGMTAYFHTPSKGFQSGSRVRVIAQNGTDVYVLDDKGRQKTLPLHHAARFSVHQPEELEFCRNDLVRCTKNTRSLERATAWGMKSQKINNGTVYRVKGFAKKTGNPILEPIKGRGKAFEIDRNSGCFTHGYTSTSYSSQGRTVDEVFIAQASGSGKAASLEQFYVSLSRGKERVRIYTDNIARLRETIRHSSNRQAAIELMERSGKKVSFTQRRSLYARLLHQWRQARNKAIEAAWEARRKIRSLKIDPQLARTLSYQYDHQR